MMTCVRGFVSLFAIFLFGISKTFCRCTSGICEKTSLSLLFNTKHNRSFHGYVFDRLRRLATVFLAPEWNSYRLSMSRMKSIQDVSSHWRATCNFPTESVDFGDYWRVTLKILDLLKEPASGGFCLWSEFVNIRGNECANCTVWTAYSSVHSLHIDSWYQGVVCDFEGRAGGVSNEDDFGFYATTNTAFRCTSSMSSTSQFWLGSF